MSTRTTGHLLLVEAYEGLIEFLSDEPAKRNAARALGLPVEEIAERLGGRITVLSWDEWVRFEYTGHSFLSWRSAPATRPHPTPPRPPRPHPYASARVRRVQMPVRDPGRGHSFAMRGLSPRAHGLLADSDPFFFASYCLHETLRDLARRDPFDAIILPMWGGLGYVAQMARATEADGHLAVPVAVVVTDTSANRQRANQEGMWSRPAIVRRQMEDLSLALADLVLVFGPRGESIARAGRLPDTSGAVRAPRHVAGALLQEIAVAARTPRPPAPVQLFLYEPQQPASGVLAALDAVTLLRTRQLALDRPLISAGPSMIFAPFTPRVFEEYWASRGSVRELMHEGSWRWRRERPATERLFPVRLYPHAFDHLPTVWTELARGSYALLSEAAAEGLAPGVAPPLECLLGPPTPECVAQALARIARADVETLDDERRALCARVVEAHRGTERVRMIEQTVDALDQLARRPPVPQNLARVARLLLDRRAPLGTLGAQPAARSVATTEPPTVPGRLSVVVTCYEMEDMVADAVRSVWNADRAPEEVLLIDDGSHGAATTATIQMLEREAAERSLPLRVIRQRNRGLAAARNAGLEAATGEFISFLDGDDLIEPPFYRIALPLLRAHPELGGVAAWAICFGEDHHDTFWNAPQPELPLLLVENNVFVPWLARTALLRQLGGYDTSQRYNYEDWEMSVRMLATGWPIVTIPMYLQRYRVRRSSLFRTMTHIQHQVMRERMLSAHRDVASRFAMEIAMQTEHRLMTLTQASGAHGMAATLTALPHYARKLAGRAHWGMWLVARSLRERYASGTRPAHVRSREAHAHDVERDIERHIEHDAAHAIRSRDELDPPPRDRRHPSTHATSDRLP